MNQRLRGAARMGGAGLVHLRGLVELEILNLDATRITDAGLVHLKGLTGLQELNLQSAKVTDAGLVHLKRMTGLQSLLRSQHSQCTPPKSPSAKFLKGKASALI